MLPPVLMPEVNPAADFASRIVTRAEVHASAEPEVGSPLHILSRRRHHLPAPTSCLPPTDVVLSREHMVTESYLSVEESADTHAWKRVWRDAEQFYLLSDTDASTIARIAGATHFFRRALKHGVTISGACGHVNKGFDFHWMCRVCQLISTRRLCCSRLTNACDVGAEFRKRDSEGYERAKNNRFNFMSGVKDRGFPAKLEWLGDRSELQYTVIGRLAFAVGVGAMGLEAALKRFERNSEVLELRDFRTVVARWRNAGASKGPIQEAPFTSFKITPVFLKTNAPFKRWQAEQERKGRSEGDVASPETPAPTTSSRLRRRTPMSYMDISDDAETVSAGGKRGGSRFDDAMSVGSKAARSDSGSRRVVVERRTPTPVGIPSGELHKIDGMLVLRLPVSDAAGYRGKGFAPRLRLQSDNWLIDEMLRRLARVAYDEVLSQHASAGVLPVHQEIRTLMVNGDRRRREELDKLHDLPATATWALQTNTSYTFDEPRSDFSAAPTQLPVHHVASTVDRIDGETCLPTTYAAMTAMEELGRVNVMNSTLLMHIIDEGESAAAAEEDFNVTEFLVRVRGAARRLAGNAVDSFQTATYHRRWALLQGADPVDAKKLLQSDTGMGVASILDVPPPPPPPVEDEEGRGEDAEMYVPHPSTDEEAEEGTSDVYASKGPSTPVSLSVSDVESVLGVLKTVINTPQSTSSLSSFVNRMSGHAVSEILAGLQNSGGGDASLTNLENLNISS